MADYSIQKITKHRITEFNPSTNVDHSGDLFWNETASPVKVKITFVGNGRVNVFSGMPYLYLVDWQEIGETTSFEVIAEPGKWVEPRVWEGSNITEIIIERVGWWHPLAVAFGFLGTVVVVAASVKRKRV